MRSVPYDAVGGDESGTANRSVSRKWPLRGCIAALVVFQLLAGGVALSGSRALQSSFDSTADVEARIARQAIITDGVRSAASMVSWFSLAAIGSALVAGALAAVHVRDRERDPGLAGRRRWPRRGFAGGIIALHLFFGMMIWQFSRIMRIVVESNEFRASGPLVLVLMAGFAISMVVTVASAAVHVSDRQRERERRSPGHQGTGDEAA